MRLDAADVPVEDKLWGLTRCLFKDDSHEVWHATARAGGYSSRHRHRKMPNKFYVVSGVLHVEQYGLDRPDKDTDPVHVMTVRAGQECTVDADYWHRFIAQTDVELIEIYWTHIPQRGDIERTDLGGVMPLPGVRAAA